MLECNITEKARDVKIVAIGDTRTLFADTVIVIKRIHRAIRMNNQQEAADYVKAIASILTDPDSPFWQEVENEQQKEES